MTKGKRPEGIVFTNADPRYAGKLDDPQGGDTTMLMQQIREVMTINQQITDESSWIWLTSEQMGFCCGQNLQMRITVKPRVRQNAMTSVLIKPHFLWRLSSQISFETQKRELYDEKLEDELEMLDLELSKNDDTKTQCNCPLHQGNASNKNGPARVKLRMQ